jgi:hypothetical protein
VVQCPQYAEAVRGGPGRPFSRVGLGGLRASAAAVQLVDGTADRLEGRMVGATLMC